MRSVRFLQVPTPLPARRALHAEPRDEEGTPGNALDEELRQPDIVEFDHRVRMIPGMMLVRHGLL